MDLLSRLVKLSGRSLRSMEDDLGMGSSVMSKVLNGVIRPQLSYVILIAGVLGVSPADFFQLAYPKKTTTHPLVQKFREATGEVVEEEQAPADLKEQVREAILDLLAELRRDKP